MPLDTILTHLWRSYRWKKTMMLSYRAFTYTMTAIAVVTIVMASIPPMLPNLLHVPPPSGPTTDT